MKSQKIHLINVLTVTLVLLSAFIAVTTFLYLYPRDIVSHTATQTTQDQYRIGDEIRVSGSNQVFINGREDNVVALQCGVASYLVRTISLPTRSSDGVQDYNFAIGTVPQGVMASPPKCRVVSHTTYHIKFFLWFERTYEVKFSSNEFDIIK